MKDISILEAKGGAGIYIYCLNHTVKPTNDISVRRALAHALDIKGVCSRIGPLVRASPSPLARVVFGATDEYWGHDYDLNKAKQLLAEAGYPKGFELQLMYNVSGLYEPITLEVQRS